MEIQKKKIIAKEIIYFVTLVVCVIITWTIVEMRNTQLHKKQEQIGNEIIICQIQLDSLKEKTLPPERMKQLVDNLTKMFEQGASDEDGRSYTKDFRDKFEEKAVLDEMSMIKEDKINLEKQRQEVNASFINNTTSDGFTKWFAIILLTILYPMRFIYRIVRWSFRTLKQKPTQ